MTPAEPSPAWQDWRRRRRRQDRGVVAARFVLLAVLLLLWEVLPRAGLVNAALTSTPSALLPALQELLRGTAQMPGLGAHVAATAGATILGFVLSTAIGILVAAALWWWPLLARVVEPYLVVANAVPKTALVPLFYLWLGPALSIPAMAVALSAFVSVLMLHAAFAATDADCARLVRSLGGTRRQVLLKLVLPGSVPAILASLKVNAGLALVGVVVGEFQSASRGLGYIIQYGSQIFRMDWVMAAIVVLALLSWLLYLAVAGLEARVMRGR